MFCLGVPSYNLINSNYFTKLTVRTVCIIILAYSVGIYCLYASIQALLFGYGIRNIDNFSSVQRKEKIFDFKQ